MKARTLFLRWLLLQGVAAAILVGFGFFYAGDLTGPALVAVPLILTLLLVASGYAGVLCWREDFHTNGREWLGFAAWLCQVTGILGTVFGFWVLLAGGGVAQELGDRIQAGGGVALAGTFIGLFASVVLELERRLLEAELTR